MKCREIIEKRETLGVAEEGETYYLGNSENPVTPINNEHDKIFRKILSNKQEAANFINKTLNVVDVNDFSKEELIKEKSFLSKAMLIEKAKDNEEVNKYLEEITTEINSDEEIYTEEIKQIFTIMIDQILKIKIGEEKAEKIMQDIRKGKGGKKKVMTVFETIEEDNKLIFSNGMKVGIKTGIKTGIRQSKVEIIKNMLKENLPIDLISKITGISQKEINKMK